jgi:UDP-N-acetyl-D-mannosaminuronic acid dehydrogenase
MAKLVENAYRDVNIAFANELSLICDHLKLDVWEVIKMANHHPRVNILQPGPGVGGHCIAVDPWFIVESAPEVARLIRTAREVNDSKPVHVARQIVDKAQRFKDPRIACLGLAFKANVDDLRESPAIEIVRSVATSLPDVTVYAVEPNVDGLPPLLDALDNVQFATSEQAIESADIVALLVDHDNFRSINRSRLAGKVVYDTRGLWR